MCSCTFPELFGRLKNHLPSTVGTQRISAFDRKLRPVQAKRVNRFFRRCGHESFLQLKMKMCPRFRLPERLKPFEFLGRTWEFLGPLKISRQKKGRSTDKASDKRHSFMFVSYQKLTASSIRRSHIRDSLNLPGRDSTERSCKKHFFCRCLAESPPEKEPNPEADLLRKRKYSARFGMGWTDAIPTCCLVRAKCLEVINVFVRG